MLKTKTKTTRRVDREGPLQRACVDFLRGAFPGAIVHHSAGERVGARAGARARDMGQVAGFPDIILILPEGRTAFFEVKAPGGRIAPVQDVFLTRMGALGHRCAVVRHVDDVRAALSDWGMA